MLSWVRERGLGEFRLACQEFSGTLTGMCHSCKHHPSCVSPWKTAENCWARKHPLALPHTTTPSSLAHSFCNTQQLETLEQHRQWMNAGSLQKVFSLLASQTRLGVICKSAMQKYCIVNHLKTSVAHAEHLIFSLRKTLRWLRRLGFRLQVSLCWMNNLSQKGQCFGE